jgi:hypothetical protein
MTWQTSSQLRLALVQQAEIWQPLLLRQQSLLDFTTQYVTQRIWNDFMSAFEKAIQTSLQKEFRRHLVAIIAGGVIVLSVIGFIVFLLVRSPNQLQSLVSASIFVVGSVVGFFGTFISRLSSFFSPTPVGATDAPERASSISALPGLAGAALVEAFQNGYRQILIEFDYLNHNVAITYPLVEYFILHSNQLAVDRAVTPTNPNASQRNFFFFTRKTPNQSLADKIMLEAKDLIKDAYDFLTHIAWTNQDRGDEIGRIARAAFGPIGAFIGAQIPTLPSQNNNPSTSKK